MTNIIRIARRFGGVLLALSVTASAPGCLVDFSGPGTNDNIPEGCGNGVFDENEDCDDFNHSDADGCSERCQVEDGWTCVGEPSLCSTICGDGLILGSEECDDGNTSSGDGCSSGCMEDPGWVCTGEPSDCNETCGNGVLDLAEDCDDGNLTPGDGCSPNCVEEDGWQCSGEPSVCDGVCGDGWMVGHEVCDDGNTASGDGCAPDCTVEDGWTCDYASDPPAGCTPLCGDGLVLGGEDCDDGNNTAGDGCASDCTVEPYAACDDVPSECVCVVYVDRDVVGGAHDGSSWASAFEQMPDALQEAGWRSPCEIWVAEGVYYTYQFGSGDYLDPPDRVSLYGGFTGTETWRSQRDFATHVTVLSGEQENNSGNRVLRILDANGVQGAIIDGFTISGALNQTSEGGGISIQGGSDMALRNCIFLDNVSEGGAAVYLRDSVATVSDSTFLNNVAERFGGAILLTNGGTLELQRCRFLGNTADIEGGAISVDNAVQLTVDRCHFIQNTSHMFGGAISLNHGGIVADITSSVFWKNIADHGGGGIEIFQIFHIVIVTSCTFYDNDALSGEGASFRVTNGDLDIRNTILWGSTTDQIFLDVGSVTLAYCDVQDGEIGPGVFSSDPAFVAPLTGDLRLSASSPCIDAGDGDAAPATDLDGNPRVDVTTIPNSGVGNPGYVDIGAYEHQP